MLFEVVYFKIKQRLNNSEESKLVAIFLRYSNVLIILSYNTESAFQLENNLF